MTQYSSCKVIVDALRFCAAHVHSPLSRVLMSWSRHVPLLSEELAFFDDTLFTVSVLDEIGMSSYEFVKLVLCVFCIACMTVLMHVCLNPCVDRVAATHAAGSIWHWNLRQSQIRTPSSSM
jgi:hypothetical protein